MHKPLLLPTSSSSSNPTPHPPPADNNSTSIPLLRRRHVTKHFQSNLLTLEINHNQNKRASTCTQPRPKITPHFRASRSSSWLTTLGKAVTLFALASLIHALPPTSAALSTAFANDSVTISSSAIDVGSADGRVPCGHYKPQGPTTMSQACPEEAPCCNQGWCSNARSMCALALGCLPASSFSDNTCLPLPKCVPFTDEFDDPSTMIPVGNFSSDPKEALWTTQFLPNYARMQDGHLVLGMEQQQDGYPVASALNKFGNRPGFGSTVSSTRWILYGTISARIRSASRLPGVVSSFIFRNDMSGDEIDFEWVGREPKAVQSNFYWRTPSNLDPKDIDYSNAMHHSGQETLADGYHDYKIEWLPDRIRWFVDDELQRTLLRADVMDDKFPSTPSQVHFSVWDGGSGDPGMMAWAGGPTTFLDHDKDDLKSTYEMWVDRVSVECYDPSGKLAKQVKQEGSQWPPKDQGFQDTVNPLDPHENQDATMLGDNAPRFSTVNRGGLHWPTEAELKPHVVTTVEELLQIPMPPRDPRLQKNDGQNGRMDPTNTLATGLAAALLASFYF